MIISLINQKGGVGKTTSTHNISFALGEKDKKVLMIDFDPQGSLTRTLGIGNDYLSRNKTIYELMTDAETSVADVIIKYDHFDFIPSTIELAAAEIELIQKGNFNTILKEKLAEPSMYYDYIVIDSPPSLGVLSVNALTASDSVIIPVETSYLAVEGMVLVFKTIQTVKKSLNKNLKIHKILPTKFEKATLHHNDVLNMLNDEYGDYVFEPIGKSVQVADSALEGISMVEFNPIHTISQTYKRLAEEIINGKN